MSLSVGGDYTLTYGNPRTVAVVPNWPMGFHPNNRAALRFWVEASPRGERVARAPLGRTTVTIKRSAWAIKACIADGSDGRTYVLELRYRLVKVLAPHFKWCREKITAEEDRYAAVHALFRLPYRCWMCGIEYNPAQSHAGRKDFFCSFRCDEASLADDDIPIGRQLADL